MDRVDCVVVGAGAVGLAVAARLARDGREVVVLERHRRHGLETSSRNSEVVHSGLYYKTGSLKATLCLEGNRRLYDYCRRRSVWCRNTGKVLVACSDDETAKLASLKRQGEDNGVEGLALIDGAEVARRAPGARALAGLWIPSTGVVDSEDLMLSFRGQAEEAGAVFLWGCELLAAARADGGYELRLSAQEEPVLAARVVNCAGLSADRVAAMPGLDGAAAGYRLHFFKGEYFALKRRRPIETLVYPVPAKHGLGIHLTIDRQGAQRLGPNSFAVARADDYEIDASHRQEFWEAARRYLPDLALDELMPGTAGIRPKLSADGAFRDFVVAEESARGLPGWINLVGIESPGLTCSLSIADRAAALAFP